MKNKKTLAVILAVIAAFLGVVTFSQQAQDKSQQQDDEPTVVKRGQATQKEREYSKEYKKRYSYHTGRKFSELIERNERRGQKAGDIGVGILEPSSPGERNSSPVTASDFLKKLSCEADAIVVGSVKSKTAHMTEDETFIYTAYEFSVQDILKNNLASSIQVNNNIEITRPGGLIKLDDRRIRVTDYSYAPLQKNKEYLLFLRYVPSASGYIVSSREGDFILDNNSFKALGGKSPPEEVSGNNDSQSLLGSIRNSVSAGCNQNPARGE